MRQRTLVAAAGLTVMVAALATPALGQTTHRWVGGAEPGLRFDDPANWDTGTLPGPDDTVLMDSGAASGMGFEQDASIARLVVRQGQLMPLLAGHTWAQIATGNAASLVIGQESGDNATLGDAVLGLGGGTLNSVDAVIGLRSNAVGRVYLGPDDYWSVSGNLGLGGTALGTGGQGTLAIAPGAHLNVAGKLTLWPSGRLELGGPAPAAPALLSMGSFDVLGTVAGSGQLTLTAESLWRFGQFQAAQPGSLNVRIAPGALVTLTNGPGIRLDGATLHNEGTFIFNAHCSALSVSRGGGIINEGLFDVQDGLLRPWVPGSGETFRNAGTLRKSGTELGWAGIHMPLISTGRIELLTGTTTFSGGGEISGSFEVGPEAEARFEAGDYTFADGMELGGPGTVTWWAGSLRSSGELVIPEGGKLSLGGTAVRFAEGHLTNRGTISLVSSTQLGDGVVLHNAAGGVIEGASGTSLQLVAGGTALLRNSGTFRGSGLVGVPMENTGRIEVPQGSRLAIDNSLSGGGSISVLEGGRLSLLSGTHDLGEVELRNDGWMGVYPSADQTLLGGVSGSGQLMVYPQRILFSAGFIRQSNLSIGGMVRITPNGTDRSTSRLTNLVIFSGQTSPQGILDLTDNDLVLTDGSPEQVLATQRLLRAGCAGGTWTGKGITSSMAAATPGMALGIIQNWDLGAGLYTVFSGQAVGADDILVKYTWFGDANLNGIIDEQDYDNLYVGLPQGLTGWFSGDFNYSGSVDVMDYALIDASAFRSGSPLARGMYELHTQLYGTEYLDALQTLGIPEPATLTLLAAATLIMRRRRYGAAAHLFRSGQAHAGSC